VEFVRIGLKVGFVVGFRVVVVDSDVGAGVVVVVVETVVAGARDVTLRVIGKRVVDGVVLIGSVVAVTAGRRVGAKLVEAGSYTGVTDGNVASLHQLLFWWES
jgi:hypothetical protein